MILEMGPEPVCEGLESILPTEVPGDVVLAFMYDWLPVPDEWSTQEVSGCLVAFCRVLGD